MSLPKIIFKYSWIYDEVLNQLRKSKTKQISFNKINKYIQGIEKLWVPNEKKILKELNKITRLKWKSKIINCYVVERCIPFSDPMTIPKYKNKDYFIDVLVHELIHQLFIQNFENTKESWNYIKTKYKKEQLKTQIHIPLHSIHKHIYLKFFNKKRLERDIIGCNKMPAYKKSWEFVEKEGYKNIIKEFKRRIK